MKAISIIKPITVTPAMVVATDVPAGDYADYAAGTTYGAGARVVYANGIYQSLQASNIGKTPDVSPTWWVFVSFINKFKLFDLVNSSQTAKATSMSYTVRPGTVVTGLAVVNLTSVTGVRVRMVSDAYGAVFDRTITRGRRPPGIGWWNWIFGRRTESLSSYFVDLPSFADAVIIVDFTGLVDMAVGTLLMGTVSSWGKGVQSGMSLGIRDYSKKETNDFGDIVLTQRAYASKQQLSLVLDAAEVDSFSALLKSLRATPCLWICSGRYGAATLYGYYQDFEILIAYFATSECSLTLESLT